MKERLHRALFGILSAEQLRGVLDNLSEKVVNALDLSTSEAMRRDPEH